MTKKIAHFLFIGLCSLSIMACQSNDVQKPKPEAAPITTLQWKDSSIDIGTMQYGEKKEITFTCTNTGQQPLRIISANPGCGCTVADFTKTEILPGKEGVVKAMFDSKKAHTDGQFQKYIVVTTNAVHKQSNLNFRGTITGAPSNDKVMIPKK